MNKLAEIQPITHVEILTGVPLDNSYRNTFSLGFFPNEAAQLAYFESKKMFEFDHMTPVSLYKPIRVPKPADGLFRANYLLFKNANFTSKIIYAFITEIRYVNPTVCEVEFEIDVMQTWLFEMNFHSCFVERQHVNDDTVGKWTLDEGFSLGDYVDSNVTIPAFLNSLSVLVYKTSSTYLEGTGTTLNSIYSGLQVNSFNVDGNGNVGGINDLLLTEVNSGTEDRIVSLNMFPSIFFEKQALNCKKVDYSVKKRNTDLDGYKPKNNKLLQAPYCYLYVTNTQGTSANYDYSLFSDNDCEFEFSCAISSNPEIVMIPKHYKGIPRNLDEKMTLSGFPQCAWSGDSYKAWLAQNASSLAIQAFGSTLGMASSLASGNIPGVIAGASSLIGEIRTIHQQDLQPAQAKGSAGSNTMFSSGDMMFTFMKKSIRADVAKSIDDYLTTYGYRIEQISFPQMTGRKSWNYVKTRGSSVTGTIPFNDLAKINSIFDSGITFWHGDYVGDYSRGNGIV